MGQHLGTAALTELWSLIKGNFARKVTATPASTTVDIQIQTEGAQTLNTATIPAATTTAAGVFTAADKTKLDSIESGATKTANITISQTQTDGNEIGGITVDGTETKLYSPKEVVDSTVTSTGANAVSGAAVTSYVAGAMTGVSTFQGVVNDPVTISGLTAYKAGWYWTVGTAGTYVGQECEVGDQIYCLTDFDTAYKDADFSVVQANVTEMTATEVDQICII